MHPDALRDRRVAVWGFGREGRSVLARLRTLLPQQTMTLFCSAAEAATLDDSAVLVRTVAPSADDLADFDVVVKSPGISPYRSPLPEASARGVRFTSATALWFAVHPEAQVVAVTGSKGKSTTSALIAHLLRAAGRRVALAGNIGLPLTELWRPQPMPDHWVVELSSYQTRDAGTLDIAVLTALFPEHLDWHGGVDAYYADKLALLDRAQQHVVAAAAASEVERLRPGEPRILADHADGWLVQGSRLRRSGREHRIPEGFPLIGAHNLANLCCALAAVEAAGMDAAALLPSLATFRALPHRFQRLGQRAGCQWIDDSIATTPQSTRAALEALDSGAVVLIAGGFDRGLDPAPLLERLRLRPLRAVVCQGSSGPRIAAAIRARLPAQAVLQADDLAEAVALARRAAQAGDCVLLSPGAPSFPEFRDYSERGQRFAGLAGFDSGNGQPELPVGIA